MFYFFCLPVWDGETKTCIGLSATYGDVRATEMETNETDAADSHVLASVQYQSASLRQYMSPGLHGLRSHRPGHAAAAAASRSLFATGTARVRVAGKQRPGTRRPVAELMCM